MCTKRVRIANLPPEVKEHALRTALTPFGTVLAVIEEMWPKDVYIYRALLSYEGQPSTCYGCRYIGHLYPTSPKRRDRVAAPRDQQHKTYATVVASSTSTPPTLTENATYVILSNNAENPVDHTLPNTDVPRHEDDTCIEDTDPPPTVEPEARRIHSDVHSETAHQQ